MPEDATMEDLEVVLEDHADFTTLQQSLSDPAWLMESLREPLENLLAGRRNPLADPTSEATGAGHEIAVHPEERFVTL